jgi:cation-transporting ATPase E
MPSPPSDVDAAAGLSSAQVAERVADGRVNLVPDSPSRTVPEILRANIFTRFNALMGTLLAIVLACGAFKDALFGGVIVANALIGIAQELRAKRTLDRLAVLSAPKASIVRDGEVDTHAVGEIVLDDVMVLRQGMEVVADAEVLAADRLEVDESLLTGESDPVTKEPGDELLSGSFVVAGSGRARVSRVGAEAYASQLAEQARRFTLAKSELQASMNKIITWVSWALVPTGAVLFWSQLRNEHASIRDGLVSATGGVVAMVPEGLILLTSVAFAVGVVRLARRRTLVRELPAIEILARVDVVCLDKTGTITEGVMDVAQVDHLGDRDDIDDALAALAWSDENPNATQLALQDHLPTAPDGWTVTDTVPFSSARKWSASAFDGRGSWVFGAPEMVIDGAAFDDIAAEVSAQAADGRRVLILASSDHPLDGEQLPPGLAPAALVMIEDRIRSDAAETLAYFDDQGVTLKVISGDNPTTVGAVARRAGLPRADSLMDARHLPGDDQPDAFADAIESTTVFGRVTPHQKQAMVAALQSRNHVVAMTGDGVNDVLALKDADVGIAMASGSDATRSVAQLVLLDSNFSGLPDVVVEGRRVINNLQRVASLFLTKTMYAAVIAIACGITGITYPFLPRHLTLVGTMVIGIPSFLLALAPNTDRVHGDFFGQVARVSIPAGLIAATATLIGYEIARGHGQYSTRQERTTAVLILAAVSLLVVIRTARPFVMWKGMLVTVMGAALFTVIVTPVGRDYFDLDLPPATMMWIIGIIVAIAGALLAAVTVAIGRLLPS